MTARLQGPFTVIADKTDVQQFGDLMSSQVCRSANVGDLAISTYPAKPHSNDGGLQAEG